MDRPIALVTHVELESLAADDLHLMAALTTLGISSSVVAWDDPTVDWGQFRLVVLRSCWNYHLKPPEFLRWLNLLEGMHVPVLNSVTWLRWNMSKRYLFDLEQRGVPIPATVSIEYSDRRTLTEIMAEHHWMAAVVKPIVSASAYSTWRVTRENAPAHESVFSQLRQQRSILVQQFLPEVVERGELSFVFIGGGYSHTVLKRAQPGDFRVQMDFGGSRSIAWPDNGLIAQAHGIFMAASPEAAYARIDAIEVQGQLVLMELELIDPVLFFSFNPDSGMNFAKAIESALLDNHWPASRS